MTLKERQEKQKQLQAAVAEAIAVIERAKHLSNELQVGFEILGRTYTPLKVVQQGGTFDHETRESTDWDESRHDWNSSFC